MKNKVLDRKLSQRGYLQFEFPIAEKVGGLIDDGLFMNFGYSKNPNNLISNLYDPNVNTGFGSETNSIKYRIPFYENISIRESKGANFVSISPIGSNTPFKIFSNGEGRKFNVTFHITLNHLYHYISEEKGKLSLSNSTVDSFNRIALKKRFKYTTDTDEGLGYEKIKTDIQNAEEAFRGNRKKDTNFLLGFLDNVLSLFGEPQPSVTRTQIKAIYLLWINLIRVANSTSAEDPRLGVPVCRLTYGQMYNRIPTICRDINITPVEEAGYDLETMIPNRVEINLSLEEVRVGNFSTYDRDNPDNEYGWDSVLVHGRIDSPTKEGDLV